MVGVLAFHGDFQEHIELLKSMKVNAIEVRSIEELEIVERLIIPGGESTVIASFLESTGVGDEIVRRVKKGTLAVYGTCAGAILLARKVTGMNSPKPLGLMNMYIERNAYGRQQQSFAAEIEVDGIKSPLPVSFIRAPIITKAKWKTKVLAEYEGHPVLVKQGRMLAGTFHPEVRGEKKIHEMFLGL